MSKEEITKEILSILGNFNLSENIQIKELVALYMKKQQETERLNNIINELEKWLLEHSKVDYSCAESIVHEQLALGIAFNYLQELKGSEKE